eukprot:scaffold3735_cov82-Cyclotella_meneghiniana.AAC.2
MPVLAHSSIARGVQPEGSRTTMESRQTSMKPKTKYLPLLPLCLAGSIGILPFLFIMVGIWICGSLLKTVCSLTEVAIRATATPGAWAFAQQKLLAFPIAKWMWKGTSSMFVVSPSTKKRKRQDDDPKKNNSNKENIRNTNTANSNKKKNQSEHKHQKKQRDWSVLESILYKARYPEHYVNLCQRIWFGKKPNPFESNMRDHLDLLLQVKQSKLTHDDTVSLLKPLKQTLAELIISKGFIANTGMLPSALWRVLQILHYATPKEVNQQDDTDRSTGNFTLFGAACCRVYRVLFTGHIARKVGVNPPEISSLGIIDLCCTVFESDCDLSSKERDTKYEEHKQSVYAALGIDKDLYFLPALLNLAIAAQLHENQYASAIDVFITTQVGPSILGLKEQRGVFSETIDDGYIVTHRLQLPHPEMFLRKRFGATGKETIEKYDKAITALLLLLPEIAKLGITNDISSNLFYKNKYGDMSPEDIEAYDAVMYENRLHAIAMRWLPIARPQLTKEDIIKLKSANFKMSDFTDGELKVIHQALSEVSIRRWLIFVGRGDEADTLIDNGFKLIDFTDGELKLIHQALSGMSIRRWLNFLGRGDEADTLINNGFKWSDFTDDELKLIHQALSELGIRRWLIFLGRGEEADKLIKSGFKWCDFSDDELKLIHTELKRICDLGRKTQSKYHEVARTKKGTKEEVEEAEQWVKAKIEKNCNRKSQNAKAKAAEHGVDIEEVEFECIRTNASGEKCGAKINALPHAKRKCMECGGEAICNETSKHWRPLKPIKQVFGYFRCEMDNCGAVVKCEINKPQGVACPNSNTIHNKRRHCNGKSQKGRWSVVPPDSSK